MSGGMCNFLPPQGDSPAPCQASPLSSSHSLITEVWGGTGSTNKPADGSSSARRSLGTQGTSPS